jgi:hypothetical protein
LLQTSGFSAPFGVGFERLGLAKYGDKHALVSAEIARIEGRELDAERLYEQAIRSAREHGFVQNEGLAHEVAARFYTARGFETIADAYLRNAVPAQGSP